MDGKIIYTSYGDLHIYDIDTQEEQVLRGLQRVGAPAWRSDGRWIAYGKEQIFGIDTYGGTLYPITEADKRYYYPAWHPTQPLIAYGVQEPGTNDAIYVQNIAEHQTWHIQLPYESVLQPAWSPDGEWLAFVGVRNGHKHIYRINVACIGQENCADQVELLVNDGRFNYSPAWSPDGKYLAYESYRSTEHWAIMLLSLEDRTQIQISPSGVDDHHPAWSADGQYLAVERQNPEGPGAEVFIIDMKGEVIKRISMFGGREPDWVTNKA